MVAVIAEYEPVVTRIRDPDTRGHRVLMAWAPFRRDAGRHGAPSSAHMGWSERLDVAQEAEPEWVVPVDLAIAMLVKANHFYDRVIKRYYLDQQSLWQVAAKLERTPGFVLSYINAACNHVELYVTHDPR